MCLQTTVLLNEKNQSYELENVLCELNLNKSVTSLQNQMDMSAVGMGMLNLKTKFFGKLPCPNQHNYPKLTFSHCLHVHF